jgi:hypothetical protein
VEGGERPGVFVRARMCVHVCMRWRACVSERGCLCARVCECACVFVCVLQKREARRRAREEERKMVSAKDGVSAESKAEQDKGACAQRRRPPPMPRTEPIYGATAAIYGVIPAIYGSPRGYL